MPAKIITFPATEGRVTYRFEWDDGTVVLVELPKPVPRGLIARLIIALAKLEKKIERP